MTSDGSPESEPPVIARSIDVYPPATPALDHPAEILADCHVSMAETHMETGECETQTSLVNEDSGGFLIGNEPTSVPNSTLVDRVSQRLIDSVGSTVISNLTSSFPPPVT